MVKDFYIDREDKKNRLGIFFVTLGLALLVATTDFLNLGGLRLYFTWEAGLVFTGIILALKRRFALGFFMIAGGVWFFGQNVNILSPNDLYLFYWPVVICITGLLTIISFPLKKLKADKKR